MSIIILPPDVQTHLRSGVAIPTPTQCVEELVLNSLDAQATCIAVRIDLHAFKLQVVDNGIGISHQDMNLIGERYATSKCHSIDDFQHLQYYGYRGEALASLRNMSCVMEIDSRAMCSNDTYSKIFSLGQTVSMRKSSNSRAGSGTTITLHNFMHNLPVRRQRISESFVFEEICQRLGSVALIHPEVSFSLRNDFTNQKCLQTKKGSSVLEMFSQLFGQSQADNLMPVHHTFDVFTVKGFISTNGFYNSSLQFIYVNKRLMLKTKLHKVVNTCFAKSLIAQRKVRRTSPKVGQMSSPSKSGEKWGIFVLDVACPLNEYDICIDPNKKLIEFKNWDAVLKCFQEVVDNFLIKENLKSCTEELPPLQGICSLEQNEKLARCTQNYECLEIKHSLQSLPAKRDCTQHFSSEIVDDTDPLIKPIELIVSSCADTALRKANSVERSAAELHSGKNVTLRSSMELVPTSYAKFKMAKQKQGIIRDRYVADKVSWSPSSKAYTPYNSFQAFKKNFSETSNVKFNFPCLDPLSSDRGMETAENVAVKSFNNATRTRKTPGQRGTVANLHKFKFTIAKHNYSKRKTTGRNDNDEHMKHESDTRLNRRKQDRKSESFDCSQFCNADNFITMPTLTKSCCNNSSIIMSASPPSPDNVTILNKESETILKDSCAKPLRKREFPVQLSVPEFPSDVVAKSSGSVTKHSKVMNDKIAVDGDGSKNKKNQTHQTQCINFNDCNIVTPSSKALDVVDSISDSGRLNTEMYLHLSCTDNNKGSVDCFRSYDESKACLTSSGASCLRKPTAVQSTELSARHNSTESLNSLEQCNNIGKNEKATGHTLGAKGGVRLSNVQAGSCEYMSGFCFHNGDRLQKSNLDKSFPGANGVYEIMGRMSPPKICAVTYENSPYNSSPLLTESISRKPLFSADVNFNCTDLKCNQPIDKDLPEQMESFDLLCKSVPIQSKLHNSSGQSYELFAHCESHVRLCHSPLFQGLRENLSGVLESILEPSSCFAEVDGKCSIPVKANDSHSLQSKAGDDNKETPLTCLEILNNNDNCIQAFSRSQEMDTEEIFAQVYREPPKTIFRLHYSMNATFGQLGGKKDTKLIHSPLSPDASHDWDTSLQAEDEVVNHPNVKEMETVICCEADDAVTHGIQETQPFEPACDSYANVSPSPVELVTSTAETNFSKAENLPLVEEVLISSRKKVLVNSSKCTKSPSRVKKQKGLSILSPSHVVLDKRKCEASPERLLKPADISPLCLCTSSESGKYTQMKSGKQLDNSNSYKELSSVAAKLGLDGDNDNTVNAKLLSSEVQKSNECVFSTPLHNSNYRKGASNAKDSILPYQNNRDTWNNYSGQLQTSFEGHILNSAKQLSHTINSNELMEDRSTGSTIQPGQNVPSLSLTDKSSSTEWIKSTQRLSAPFCEEPMSGNLGQIAGTTSNDEIKNSSTTVLQNPIKSASLQNQNASQLADQIKDTDSTESTIHPGQNCHSTLSIGTEQDSYAWVNQFLTPFSSWQQMNNCKKVVQLVKDAPELLDNKAKICLGSTPQQETLCTESESDGDVASCDGQAVSSVLPNMISNSKINCVIVAESPELTCGIACDVSPNQSVSKKNTTELVMTEHANLRHTPSLNCTLPSEENCKNDRLCSRNLEPSDVATDVESSRSSQGNHKNYNSVASPLICAHSLAASQKQDVTSLDNEDKCLDKDSMWQCQFDNISGRYVYIHQVTGLSSFDPPSSGKQFIQRADIGYESASLLGPIAVPFHPHSDMGRANANKLCVTDKLQGKDEFWEVWEKTAASEPYVKWKHIQEAELASSSVFPLLLDWENPMWKRLQEEVSGINVKDGTCSGKMDPILHPCQLSRSFLNSCKVLSQLDNKFIVCLSSIDSVNEANSNLVVLFDQHAVDERVRLENLQADVRTQDDAGTFILKSSGLDPPMVLNLDLAEVRLVGSCLPILFRWGFRVALHPSDRTAIYVHSVPTCLLEREASEVKRKRPSVTKSLVQDILRDGITMLQATGGSSHIMPQSLHNILCSQACHGAIKFGDRLDFQECQELVRQLCKCRLPFQCAHGRPTVVPLLDLRMLRRKNILEVNDKPKLWKITSSIRMKKLATCK